MSKAVNVMKFKDDKGYICAIRKDYCTESEAEQIAKDTLFTESVNRTNEYKHMYHGFGKAIGMDEYENSWWLIGDPTKNSVEVYAFREG